MINNNPHIIQKISAELTLPSADEQEKQSAQLKEAIYEALERLEPQLNHQFEGMTCRFQSLSVAVNVNHDQLSDLPKKLEKVLASKIIEAGETIQNKTGGETEKQQPDKIDPDRRRRELLLHFLQSGRLPWWADRDEAFSTMEKELATFFDQKNRKLVRKLVQKNAAVLPRVINQFPEKLVQDLIRQWATENFRIKQLFDMVDDFSTFFEAKNVGYGKTQRMKNRFNKWIFAGVIKEHRHKAVKHRLISAFLNEISLTDSRKPLKDLLKGSELRNKKEVLQFVEESTSERNAERSSSKKESSARKQGEVNESVSLTVANAGLVLFQPFIQRFFANLGLLEEEAFTGEAARERAVCLLHYLATGSDEFPEPELVLPKFMCHWPLEQPVNRFLPISDYEKDEAHAVLQSVIDHWKTLKNTSVDTLRQTFLQREGLLGKEEFGWSLHIEKQTQDILLEKLPWGLSVVKFPWMDKMLTINWT